MFRLSLSLETLPSFPSTYTPVSFLSSVSAAMNVVTYSVVRSKQRVVGHSPWAPLPPLFFVPLSAHSHLEMPNALPKPTPAAYAQSMGFGNVPRSPPTVDSELRGKPRSLLDGVLVIVGHKRNMCQKAADPVTASTSAPLLTALLY